MEIVTWNYIIVYKLLVLEKNTWNHKTVIITWIRQDILHCYHLRDEEEKKTLKKQQNKKYKYKCTMYKILKLLFIK